jgi:hypothetical protein
MPKPSGPLARRGFLKGAARADENGPVPAWVGPHRRSPRFRLHVNVLKHIGFEFICANPGSSFRALHESIVNYGGYARIEGKPLASWRTAR